MKDSAIIRSSHSNSRHNRNYNLNQQLQQLHNRQPQQRVLVVEEEEMEIIRRSEAQATVSRQAVDHQVPVGRQEAVEEMEEQQDYLDKDLRYRVV